MAVSGTFGESLTHRECPYHTEVIPGTNFLLPREAQPPDAEDWVAESHCTTFVICQSEGPH